MAEAWTRALCHGDWEAASAGLEPGTIHPLTVAVMLEKGIDLHGKPTRSVADVMASGERFDFVVTVCDETSAEKCPLFPGTTQRLHWGFRDPSSAVGSQAEKLEVFRQVRDEIRDQIEQWCAAVCGASGELAEAAQ